VAFRNRVDAGAQLGRAVADLGLTDPIVLALPRGGVPVGAEVARALSAPLDVVLVRKLGHPAQPELAVGALAEDGRVYLDETLATRTSLGGRDLDAIVEREQREIDRQRERFRAGRPAPDLQGRAVVLVDDGLATGATARVALGWVRDRGGSPSVIAAPVAPPDALLTLNADQAVILETPSPFGAVGRWYLDFSPVRDEQVVELLHS
jgi:putative phosphoribosyl transferase